MILTNEVLKKILTPDNKTYKLTVHYNIRRVKYILDNYEYINKILTQDGLNGDGITRSQLEWIYSNYKDEGIKIEFATKRGYGRLYPKNGAVSYVQMERPIRHFLAFNKYTDIDIDNCHPKIIEEIYKLIMEGECESLSIWNSNRKELFARIMTINSKLTRDDCKDLGYCLLYDGNLKKVLIDMGIPYSDEISKLAFGIHKDIKRLIERIKYVLKTEWESINVPSDTPHGREDVSRFSILIQHIERHLILQCHKYINKKNVYLLQGDFAHDGLFICTTNLKSLDKDTSTILINDLKTKIYKSTGFDVNLSVKEFNLPDWTESYITDDMDNEEFDYEPLDESGVDMSKVMERFNTLPKPIKFNIEIDKTEDWEKCIKGLKPKEIEYLYSEYFKHYWVQIQDKWYLMNPETGRINNLSDGFTYTSMYNMFRYTRFLDMDCKKYMGIHFGDDNGLSATEYNIFFPNYDRNIDDELTEDEMLSIKPFLYHMNEIYCKGNKENYDFLIKWFGIKLRYPFDVTKLPVALVLIGEQGSGKSAPMEVLFKELFGYDDFVYSPKSFEASIGGDFNGETRYNLINIFNEIPPMKNTRESIWNDFKTRVSESTRPLHTKGKTVQVIDNCVTYILCSNNRNAIKTEASDRRWFLLETSSEKIGDSEYFQELLDNIRTNHKIIAKYCLNQSKGLSIGIPPMTELKEASINLNRDAYGTFILDVLDRDPNFFNIAIGRRQMCVYYKSWGELTNSIKFKASEKDITLGLDKYLSIHQSGNNKLYKGISKGGAKLLRYELKNDSEQLINNNKDNYTESGFLSLFADK